MLPTLLLRRPGSIFDAICIRFWLGGLSRKHQMPATRPPSLRFSEMTRRQKIVFVLKVAVCVLSFGMIYPNIMNE